MYIYIYIYIYITYIYMYIDIYVTFCQTLKAEIEQRRLNDPTRTRTQATQI